MKCPICLLGAVLLSHLLMSLPAEAAFNLTVVHTNDVHARFEQFSKYGSDCRPKDAEKGHCYGGVARRVTALRKLRKESQNLLLLDAGDQFQGTLWFYVHKGMAAAHFMNSMQYDVMALGNHEFDNGVQGAVDFVKNVTCAVVSANINAEKYGTLNRILQPSKTEERGGERIGIIGYITTDTPQVSQTGSLIFEDEITAIRREVKKLQSKGINKIIALGHAGWKTDLAIAREVQGVDLVVGGHTNTFLYTGPAPADEDPVGKYPTVVEQASGAKVLVVQDYAFGKYLGVLNVTFDDDGNVMSWSGNPMLLDASVEQDDTTLAQMVEMKAPLIASFSKTLGRSHVLLDGARKSCRLRECNLGNFVADALVAWHMKFPDERYWANVSLAIFNGGGIRTSIQPGDVALKDVYNVFPFSNTIDLIELHGRDLLALFEHSVTDFDPEIQKGRFLQVAGIRVVYDLSGKNGNRVVDLHVRCSNCTVPVYEPINNNQIYKVIVPSFLVGGGDGYDMIAKNMLRHHVYGDLDIDLLVQHIIRNSPIMAEVQGRIAFVDDSYCKRPGCGNLEAIAHQQLNAASVRGEMLMSLVFVFLRVFSGI